MDTTIFSKYLLPVVIGLIMFNLGLSLTFNDFKRTFKLPKALLIGLCSQMLLLPIIAFGLASISGLSPALQIGIVIIAACPGGATSNLITYLLKGDVALSISLTAINSILILFSIPSITYLALNVFSASETFISLPFAQTIIKIILMILLPTLMGLLSRMKLPLFAKRVESHMKYVTTILLAIVFAFTIFENNSQTNNSIKLYLSTLPVALGLNLAGMIIGYFISRLAKFKKNKQITLVIEVGIQNSALAITIASSSVFLGNSQMAIPAVIYGMFTFINAAIFGFVIKKWLH